MIAFNQLETREVLKTAKELGLKILNLIKTSEAEKAENYSARSAELIILAKSKCPLT